MIGFTLFNYSCTKQLCNKENLIDTFQKKNKSLITQDTFALSVLASKQLSFIHSNGWIEDYNSFTSSGASKSLIYNHINIDSIHAIIENKTGLITGVGTFDVIYKNNPIKLKLGFTETYVCIDNEWKLLARHSSKL